MILFLNETILFRTGFVLMSYKLQWIEIIGFRTCKLVRMLLHQDYPSCTCCCWSSWELGRCDNRVHIVIFHLTYPHKDVHSSTLIKSFIRFAETGEALVSSVDKMIFVGSTGVGRMVWTIFGLAYYIFLLVYFWFLSFIDTVV